MPSAINYRLLGYSVTLVLHIITFIDVKSRLRANSDDERVARFEKLEAKFLTIWTYCLQVAYAALGLSCDMLVLLSREPGSVSKLLVRVRELLFSALVWPSSLTVGLIFWPMYLYNPMLIFPAYIEKILSSTNNQVLHTAIIFIVFWELAFLPRSAPTSHLSRISICTGYFLWYLAVLLTYYFENGRWLYPLLNKLDGTIFIPILFAVMFVVGLFIYYIQWPLTRYLHKHNQNDTQERKIK